MRDSDLYCSTYVWQVFERRERASQKFSRIADDHLNFLAEWQCDFHIIYLSIITSIRLAQSGIRIVKTHTQIFIYLLICTLWFWNFICKTDMHEPEWSCKNWSFVVQVLKEVRHRVPLLLSPKIWSQCFIHVMTLKENTLVISNGLDSAVLSTVWRKNKTLRMVMDDRIHCRYFWSSRRCSITLTTLLSKVSYLHI